ncbi:hypothetical protein HDK77DRAFT_432796 [Phyllosticta capitalensis]
MTTAVLLSLCIANLSGESSTPSQCLSIPLPIHPQPLFPRPSTINPTQDFASIPPSLDLARFPSHSWTLLHFTHAARLVSTTSAALVLCCIPPRGDGRGGKAVRSHVDKVDAFAVNNGSFFCVDCDGFVCFRFRAACVCGLWA